MRLPASGKARFGLGFWPIVGFFVLANLVTVVVVDRSRWDFLSAFIPGVNDIGYPFVFTGLQENTGFVGFWGIPFAFDVVIWFGSAAALGFMLYKFGDPNRGLRYLCKRCGYDLRGIPSSVCPECGAAAERGDNRADP